MFDEEAVWLLFVQTEVCWQRIRFGFEGRAVDGSGLPDDRTEGRGPTPIVNGVFVQVLP